MEIFYFSKIRLARARSVRQPARHRQHVGFPAVVLRVQRGGVHRCTQLGLLVQHDQQLRQTQGTPRGYNGHRL